MSALGQKATCALQDVMSALPPEADLCSALADFCFGPIADLNRMCVLQSTLIFPASITFFQRCVSLARNSTNCAPLVPTTSKPMSLNCFFTSGELTAAANSDSSLVRTSAVRPFGAAAACQE